MSDTLLDFNVVYVKNIATIPDLWNNDMEYLRSRISTNRSISGDRLTLDDGRIYEGAKTLVDMLELMFFIKRPFVLNQVHVELSNQTDFPHALLTATIRVEDGPDVYGPIDIHFIFTNAGQRTNYGGFITSAVASTGTAKPITSGVGTTLIRDHFGNVPPLEKYVSLDEKYCYKAGQALRYCENIPTPSEFVNELDMAISDIMEGLAMLATKEE